MKKLHKLTVGVLLTALCTTTPFTARAETTPVPPPTTSTTTHGVAGTVGGGGQLGIIAITVSILGLIALAASSTSGDSTPTATNH